MNYFLILGIIVIIVLFLAILLNNISKIVTQSEGKDVIFSILGFLLAISIFVMFTITSYSLEKTFIENIKVASITMLIDPDIRVKSDSIITVKIDDSLQNIIVDENTLYTKNETMAGKIRIEIFTYQAPETWYVMKWKLDSINNTKLIIAKEIFI